MYEVSLLDKIDFAAEGIAAKLQNVRFILSTVLQSCPMDRLFGIDPELDAPTEYFKANFAAHIIDAIQLNEPGAIVTEVNFEEGITDYMIGRLIPRVKVVFEDGAV